MEKPALYYLQQNVLVLPRRGPPAYNGGRAAPTVPDGQLFAATSGTDSDWVVKLIDVYPDETPRQPQMGGYQLMVSPTSSAAVIARVASTRS